MKEKFETDPWNGDTLRVPSTSEQPQNSCCHSDGLGGCDITESSCSQSNPLCTSSSDLQYNEQQIQELANQIELIIKFCSPLIPHIGKLKEMVDNLKDKESHTASAHVVIEALGGNTDRILTETSLRRKRCEALVNLVTILRDTELSRIQQRKQDASNSEILKMFE